MPSTSMKGIQVSNPTEYKIPSRSYGITADEAAEVLVTANEIKANKKLHKAAIRALKDKKKAVDGAIP